MAILDRTTVSKIVELLLFTYDNTGLHKSEAAPEGGDPTLRQGVIAIATGLGKELLGFNDFKAILRAGGDLVLNLSLTWRYDCL